MHKTEKYSITGMSLTDTEELCVSVGEPVYRAKQILSWVYEKGVTTFDEMSNLPKNFRNQLEEKYKVFQTRVDSITQTADGSEKFLLHLFDGNAIESVLLREDKRVTSCISTQVGCAMACCFCASGVLGFERNLTAAEMVEQALYIKNHLRNEERLTNIVFMGIGEPLNNYDNVVKAIRIMNAEWGLGIGARHITISTVGIIEGIHRLAREGIQVNLAISLHAPNDIIRSKIIPSNKKTGINNIVAAAREYFKTTRRDISFEYVLIDGVNSSRQDAEVLAKLLKRIQCNVNLLSVNPVEEFYLKPPSDEAVGMFCKILGKQGLVVTIRKKKGDDVNAACGQLRLQRQKFLWKK